MVQKGMTMALKVVVVIVVILVVAFMVLTVFSGGIGKAGDQINKWFEVIGKEKPLDLNVGGNTCSGSCVENVAACSFGTQGTGTCPTAEKPYCCV